MKKDRDGLDFSESPIMMAPRSAAAGAFEENNPRADLYKICKKHRIGCDDELMAVWLRMLPRPQH